MIYLIAGSPRSGKTTLAKYLASKLNIQLVSTDLLRLFMIESLEHPEKYTYFPFEQIFDSHPNIETFYAIEEAETILQADIIEAHKMWPGISALITHYSNHKQDCILEGVHFLPELVQEFSSRDNYRTLILTKTNPKLIFDGLKANQGNGDWIADNIQDDTILQKTANSISEYGKYFEEEANKYALKFINTENNFESELQLGLEFLTL